jgi:uncharacterized lipoprotein YmbA
MAKVGLLVALLVAACASQKPKQAQVAYSTDGHAKPVGKEQCHLERTIGSNLMEKVCVYRDADDAARLETQDALIRMQQSGAQTPSAHGGG